MSRLRWGICLSVLCTAARLPSFASTGTEAAAFLEIPVGARPAAMGAAYAPLAEDAYAAVWNPAGLAFLPETQVAAQHLSYLESIHYEFLSVVRPTRPGGAWGASAQYLGSGDITQTNDSGQRIGNFSSHFAAYTASYGQKITERIALGVSAKWVNAKISDVGANAFAGDAGLMMEVNEKLTLAGVIANAGTKLKFLDDGGSLPLTAKLAAAYRVTSQWLVAVEGDEQAGLASGHVGIEYHPMSFLSIRTGYRTDTTKELSALAGVSAGLGLDVWGQEFSYAWLPYGDLGTTQYFSLLLRFGASRDARKNLIRYEPIRTHRTVHKNSKSTEDDKKHDDPEYQQLMQLLDDSPAHLAEKQKENEVSNPQ
jgi:hypothetical protein